jgi:exopolysaccharide production protein ExoY
MDFTAAVVLVILTLPLLLLISLLVAGDRGPVLYVHRRVGRNGIAFNRLKFRTMRPNADARLAAILAVDPAKRVEPTRKLRHDPRVTWIGRFLRAASLDELPQLLNVIRGEMSLVGPRPVTMDELYIYYNHCGPVARAAYLSVRPDITGLWQVSGRSQTGYSDRIRLDEHYARTGSFSTDVAILGRTFVAVEQRKGAW